MMASTRSTPLDDSSSSDSEMEPLAPCDPQDPKKPATFDYITENAYSSEILTSRDRKRAKRMVCDCQFDPELDDPEDACGETCLNKLLMIECGSKCPCGEYCTNKRYQRAEYAEVEVFKTDLKGWGLRALKPILPGGFVMEYCGEVCTPAEFEQRKKDYVLEKRRHYYFMSLKTDQILDATRKGNLSRFINHSCDPNCETQKWTVNGRLRVGFFSIRGITADEELTFDYQFQRFGEVAQKCFCGSANCRGYLGATKQTATGRLSAPQREMGSPRSPSVREGRKRMRHRTQSDADTMFEKEVYDIVGSSWRLKNSDQVIAISRIMLQAETPSQRIMLLQVLQATEDAVCLRKFLSLHGLRLLWSWMVDSSDSTLPDIPQFRLQVLQTLNHLPITSKNQLEDSKVLPVIRRWSIKPEKPPKSSEPIETLEGTVVTEADSAPCDSGGEAPGGVAEGVAREEEGTCEAEAREMSASESQDECEAVEDKLLSLSSELLEKWSVLKEVFRIPKRVQPLKKASPVRDLPRQQDSEERDDKKARRSKMKHNPQDSPEPPPSRSWKQRPLLPSPKPPQSRRKSKPHIQTHDQPRSYTYGGYTAAAGHTGTTGFAAPAPVQNTVIVQHPGQSVYVQQQVFQDGCQTTILPTPYVHPPQQFLTQPSSLPALEPLPLQTDTQTHNIAQQTTGLVQYPIGQQPRVMAGQSFATAGSSFVQGVGGYQLPVGRQYLTNPQVYIQPTANPTPLSLAPLPPPPPEEEINLPPHWKTARDPQGKIYYYHTITRKSQWERPTDKDAEGTITMDLATPEREEDSSDSDVESLRQPHTPEGSPPPTPHHEESEEASEMSGTSPHMPVPRSPSHSPPPTNHETKSLSQPHTPPIPSHSHTSTSQKAPSTSSSSCLSPRISTLPPSSSPKSPPIPLFPHSPSPHSPLPHSPLPHSPSCTPPNSQSSSPPTEAQPLSSCLPMSPPTSPPNSHSPTPHSPLPHSPAPHSPLPHSPLPHSPLPHSPLPHSPLPHSPLPHSPLPHSPLPHSPLPHSPLPHSPTPHSPLPHSPTPHSPLPHSPTPHSPLPHSLTPHSPLPHSPLPHSPSPHSPLSQSPLSHSPLASPPPTSQDDVTVTAPPRKRPKLEGKRRSKYERALKESFRHKVSKVVTHCLDQHRKPECKYGRITCSDDFKYLARKLTYGLTEKEIGRKGGIEKLVFNPSVKSKIKDYIRQYMKKHGALYQRS